MVCERTERMLVHIISSLSTWSEVTTYHISVIKCCDCYLFHKLVNSSTNYGFEKSLLCQDSHNVATRGWSEMSSFFVYVIALLQSATYTYHFLAFFQWIHKSLTLCVSQSFLDRVGEHDQQSILLSSCSQQNCLGRTCHEVILMLLK